MPGEVAGQVAWRLGNPRPYDEGEPGVLDRVQIRCRQHPRIGYHDHPGHPVTGLERAQDRQQSGRLGGVPLKQMDLKREPGRVDQQPHLDLGIDPVFLTDPDLAQRVRAGVLVAGLEVQRRHVIHDQRPETAGGGRMRDARRGEQTPVIPVLAPLQGPEQRAQARGRAPISPSTRRLSAFEVGSTIRASTIARNASSPRTSNPRWEYASLSTRHSSRDEVATTRPSGRPPARALAASPLTAGRRREASNRPR